jgi:acetylornithine deacetylase/succinyl-diaminopimelate desuccinylase-like protein
MATGLVPSTFRIARILLSRIEDENTGDVKLKEAHCANLPEKRLEQCRQVAAYLGERSHEIVSRLPGAKLVTEDYGQLLINKAWKPGLAVTGCDGIPAIANGSNVMRKETSLKLSLRIPPFVEAEEVGAALKKVLENDAPYGAAVSYTVQGAGNGWCGPEFTPEMDRAIAFAAKEIFGKEAEPLYYGEGGSIPLCNKFQSLWPNAQTLVTGCAGTDSNPHGYDESLDLPYTGKFTALVAVLLTQSAA